MGLISLLDLNNYVFVVVHEPSRKPQEELLYSLKYMDNDHRGSNRKESFVKSLKNEWSLFWDSLSIDDSSEDQDPFVTGKLQVLSLDNIKAMSRALSQDRKKLNQKLESLNKEIELNTIKLDSLRLVGSEDQETLKKINELSDLGQSLSLELNKIDQRLKWVREQEEEARRKDQLA